MDIGKVFSSVGKIRLPGGMVGKFCTVLIVTAVSIAVISWSVKDVRIAALGMVLVSVLVFSLGWRILSFAEKNPEVALFDGAELLMHHKLRLGKKGEPSMPFDPDEQQVEPVKLIDMTQQTDELDQADIDNA